MKENDTEKLQQGQTIKTVELKYSKPVKVGKKSKKPRPHLDKTNFGGVIGKHIQVYKVWFLFLKLALDLQDQEAVLVLKHKRKIAVKNKAGDILSHQIFPQETKRIRVNESKYKGWDLEEVRKLSWDKWLKTHLYLFTDEGIQVLSPKEEIGDEPHHLYIRINTRRRITDTITEIRKKLIREKQRHITDKEEFQIWGNPRHPVLMNKYNALVLKLMGWKDKKILDPASGFMRLYHPKTKKDGYSINDAGRTMYDLISASEKTNGAKQILLNVCDGCFPTKQKPSS